MPVYKNREEMVEHARQLREERAKRRRIEEAIKREGGPDVLMTVERFLELVDELGLTKEE
jgi:hypothetical protein